MGGMAYYVIYKHTFVPPSGTTSNSNSLPNEEKNCLLGWFLHLETNLGETATVCVKKSLYYLNFIVVPESYPKKG